MTSGAIGGRRVPFKNSAGSSLTPTLAANSMSVANCSRAETSPAGSARSSPSPGGSGSDRVAVPMRDRPSGHRPLLKKTPTL